MSNSDTTNNQDLIEAARAGVNIEGRHDVITGVDHNGDDFEVDVALVVGADGSSRIEVMKDAIAEYERRASGPRRRTGEVVLGGLPDFVSYVNRFKTPDVVVFAPLSPPGVTAIFDYHPGTAIIEGQAPDPLPKASWCQDRASYRCPLSRQWKLWTEREGRPFTQVDFGDFIEANQLDLTNKGDLATATRMLEVARNLVIHSVGKFERKIDQTSGTGTLVIKDEHSENSTKIPKGFALAIPVFEGAEEHYLIEAQLRFAMVESKPTFSFLLQNKEKVFEDALAALRKFVADGCGVPVFVGAAPSPAGAR